MQRDGKTAGRMGSRCLSFAHAKIEQAAHIPLFADLRHEEFLHVFLLGLMNRYLRLTAAPVSCTLMNLLRCWKEFYAETAGVGSRNPRYSAGKTGANSAGLDAESPGCWTGRCSAPSSPWILPILFFVGSTVEYSFRKYNVPVDNQVQNLTPQQTEFLQRVFGPVYSELPKEAQTNVFSMRFIRPAAAA
jgi:hypothetical protein